MPEFRGGTPRESSCRWDSENSASAPSAAGCSFSISAPSASTSTPSSPTGTPMTRAPPRWNTLRNPGYTGSSISTVSPRDASTRWIRSNACWQPLVIRMSSSSRATSAASRFVQAADGAADHSRWPGPVARYSAPHRSRSPRGRCARNSSSGNSILRRPRCGKTDGCVWRHGRWPAIFGGNQRLPIELRGFGSFHETAAADVSFDEMLGFKQLVSGGDSGPVQAKRPSQFPSGWQALATNHAARDNRGTQLFMELPVKGHVRRMIELDAG